MLCSFMQSYVTCHVMQLYVKLCHPSCHAASCKAMPPIMSWYAASYNVMSPVMSYYAVLCKGMSPSLTNHLAIYSFHNLVISIYEQLWEALHRTCRPTLSWRVNILHISYKVRLDLPLWSDGGADVGAKTCLTKTFLKHCYIAQTLYVTQTFLSSRRITMPIIIIRNNFWCSCICSARNQRPRSHKEKISLKSLCKMAKNFLRWLRNLNEAVSEHSKVLNLSNWRIKTYIV